MAIDRRGFLGTLGAASVVAALPLIESEARAEQAAGNTWDMSWVAKVKGKYRAVFDSPQVSGGAALFRAVTWAKDYKTVYGTTPSEMSAVLVVRHQGIWLAMNDAFWQKYEVGKAEKLKDDKKQWQTRNPVATSAAGTPPDSADINIPKFLENGNVILACNLAFGSVVDLVAKADKLSHDDAEKKAKTYIMPGILLQPSGVFAVLHAQETGCRYLLAS